MFKDSLTPKTPLWEALQKQLAQVKHRFHVPAHQAGVCDSRRAELDLTELAHLDNLFYPTGALAESQDLLAKSFGSEKSYYLVNGSSGGIIAAIWSLCHPGDKVIVSRNVHRSVITGIVLSGAEPLFVPVEDFTSGLPLNINVNNFESILARTEAPRAAIVNSPSYWGIAPNLYKLGQIAQEKGLPLIVDEAHGGHFIFHHQFPLSARDCGADIWVNSAHKTLGALTPGAFLHRQGKRVNINALEDALSMFQTSSPPYPVLASLEAVKDEQNRDWEAVISLSQYAKEQINQMRGFSCLEIPENLQGVESEFEMDPLRLTVITREVSLNGYQVGELLREEYGIEVEMSGFHYVLAIVHPQHGNKDVDALLRALKNIANDYPGEGWKPGNLEQAYPIPILAITPRQAAQGEKREIPLAEAGGRVSAAPVYPFPPGIPALIPGELIQEETLQRLKTLCSQGISVPGLGPAPNRHILVMDE